MSRYVWSFRPNNYAANAFAEAALDMTALITGLTRAVARIQNDHGEDEVIAIEHRDIGDFIDPIHTLCESARAPMPEATRRAAPKRINRICLQGKASAAWHRLPRHVEWSTSAIIDSPNSLVTTVHVSSATATLRLSVAQANGCSETNELCSPFVNPPSCSITGLATLCPNSTNVFQGPAGMDGYAGRSAETGSSPA